MYFPSYETRKLQSSTLASEP